MSSPITQADGGPRVAVTLTEAQVRRVLRAAGGARGAVALLAGPGLEKAHGLRGVLDALYADKRLSRSVLMFVATLAAFPTDGTPRAITEVARELEQSPSTAYRYAHTAVELGLLERDPGTRKYRSPLFAGAVQ